MVLVATPSEVSSGHRRRCSTATIDNDIMALMLCPSVLSAPTLMGYLYAYNAILRAPTTIAAAAYDKEVRCGAGVFLRSVSSGQL